MRGATKLDFRHKLGFSVQSTETIIDMLNTSKLIKLTKTGVNLSIH